MIKFRIFCDCKNHNWKFSFSRVLRKMVNDKISYLLRLQKSKLKILIFAVIDNKVLLVWERGGRWSESGVGGGPNTLPWGTPVWEVVYNPVSLLPQIFCVHGGIPSPENGGGYLNVFEDIPHDLPDPEKTCRLAWEVMWSDPLRYLTLSINTYLM